MPDIYYLPYVLTLPFFALTILTIVYIIDLKIRARRKESEKFKYLFTERKKSETLRMKQNKGRF